jgi:hypothetical protein
MENQDHKDIAKQPQQDLEKAETQEPVKPVEEEDIIDVNYEDVEQDTTVGLIKEFFQFLGERKKFWLMPIIIVLILLGALIIFTSTSAVAPFIYAIF